MKKGSHLKKQFRKPINEHGVPGYLAYLEKVDRNDKANYKVLGDSQFTSLFERINQKMETTPSQINKTKSTV